MRSCALPAAELEAKPFDRPAEEAELLDAFSRYERGPDRLALAFDGDHKRGELVTLLGRNGASVKDGSIAAESPGGKLQYRPPAAQSMGATNQGMKMVLDALDDFHYSVLSSNVSYDTSGKLLLGLTLKGQNPALEAGRAINLNINLEEDIPALITSLQLSSKISDKIKQRVQQHLQQSGAKRANGVQP